MSSFNGNAPEHFIQVKPGSYLSKADPRFIEKYVKYFPKDAEMQYAYGEQLQKRGKLREAIHAYRKSLKLGYIPADARIQEIKEEALVMTVPKEESETKKTPWFFILFFGIINVLLFTGLILFLANKLFQLPYHMDASIIEKNGGQDMQEINGLTCEIDYKPLQIIVVQNALERFKEEKGSYPIDLILLTQETPSNWLSYIPSGVGYEKKGDGYNLYWNNDEIYSEQLLNNTIELYHYPDTNELAVMNGETMLAKYEVAAGEKELPFVKSRVTARVVDPNGGAGPLGTRGLVLQDNYAIHGTNNPNSIGADITHGCLRLLNRDIEILYSYISIGTPFSVKKGDPAMVPLYPDGLPPLLPARQKQLLEKEKQPAVQFNWKE